MFTGIVEEVGNVKAADPGILVVGASEVLGGLKIGDSVCVNGACLTATIVNSSSFTVNVVPETLRRTNLGALNVGDPVNLERALPADGRFGGHIVQGHVDSTGQVTSISTEGEALLVTFEAPSSVMRYVVEKGFITVDGTSLTVVNCDNRSFLVTIIPHTQTNTILGTRKVGDLVNLETDIVAKYVERLSGGARVPLDIAEEL